jgi:RimJ/RimL family protein N-acetyltransferase
MNVSGGTGLMTHSFLPIRTERLELRTLVPSDLDAVVSYYCLPEVQRYLDWRARDRRECKQALDGMRGQIALNRPGDALTLGIVRQKDDALVGHVSVRWHDATASQAELRLVINPLFRRQGYATEAVRAVMDLGFEQFRFHRVFAKCDARNQAAALMMKKLGMRLEAHYREHALFQGEWDEELHFAVLNREWRRSSKVRELTHLVA